MKFQLKMGQTESLKKIRELKKDIARVQTVMRQKQIAGRATGDAPSPRSASQAPAKTERRRPRRRLQRRKSKPWPKRQQPTNEKAAGRRKTLIGKVVSTKMAKTIVVEVRRQKAHPFYKRVVARSKKFYAHDEDKTAHVGDFVKIEETRPLSKLKRWQLKEIVQRAALVAPAEEKTT